MKILPQRNHQKESYHDMLQKLREAVKWLGAKLEYLFQQFGEDYARELLAAHGLLDIETDHMRRKRAADERTDRTDYQI